MIAITNTVTAMAKWPKRVARESDALNRLEKQLKPMQHAHSHRFAARQATMLPMIHSLEEYEQNYEDLLKTVELLQSVAELLVGKAGIPLSM